MAKSRKNKAGLHKDVLSVLKDVPIPQGVRNRRPHEKSGPDRTDDSFPVLKSNVSSVFKGVPVTPGDVTRPPAGKHPQNNCSEVSPFERPNDRQTLQSDRVKKFDRPEEPEFVNEVVYYRDPTQEAVPRTLGQWIQDSFFAPWEWLKHLLRRFSTKKE